MAIPPEIRKRVQIEQARCAEDPIYFMKNHAYIQHPVRGTIKFDLYAFQDDVLRDLRTGDNTIILKSRQLGISTLVAGFTLWMMTFQRDRNIIVIATKQETAKNFVTKVRFMYDHLPKYLRRPVDEHNKLSLKFKNGSQVKAASAAPDSARSEAASMLVIDEAAFIDNAEEIWTSAQQTISTGGQALLLSTPNGVGNFYHKMWVEATDGVNGFRAVYLPWTVHPDRNQEWRDKQDKELGVDKARQECDCDFLAAGRNVIPPDTCKWYTENHVLSPIEKRGAEDALWIWEYPQIGREYIISADVSRGDGSDYSAFHVLDSQTLEQVAEYKGKLDTKTYGNLLVSVGTEYNDALVVVENANIGWAVLQQIIDRGYPNIHYTYKEDGYVDPSIQIPKGYDIAQKEKMVPGFTTSSKTRPLIISKLEDHFREKTVIIRSKRTIDELMVFVWKGTRPEHQNGYHDDLILSLCIGLWVRDVHMKLKTAGMMLTRASVNAIKSNNVVFMNSSKNDQKDMARASWTFSPDGNNSFDLREFLK